MKELILQYDNTEKLKEVIKNNYFEKGDRGKITDNTVLLKIDEDDTVYKTLKGMSYKTVKLTNEKVVGTITCDIVNESGNFIELKTSSLYCMKERNKYSFY